MLISGIMSSLLVAHFHFLALRVFLSEYVSEVKLYRRSLSDVLKLFILQVRLNGK